MHQPFEINASTSSRGISHSSPHSTMNAGESKQYAGIVQIPQGVQPTYKGVNAIHIWKIRAYADVPMFSGHRSREGDHHSLTMTLSDPGQ